MNDFRCARCGGEVASGQLMRRDLAFFPHDAPLLSLGHVPVSTWMCLDCGSIELRGDVQRARQLLKRNNTQEGSSKS